MCEKKCTDLEGILVGKSTYMVQSRKINSERFVVTHFFEWEKRKDEFPSKNTQGFVWLPLKRSAFFSYWPLMSRPFGLLREARRERHYCVEQWAHFTTRGKGKDISLALHWSLCLCKKIFVFFGGRVSSHLHLSVPMCIESCCLCVLLWVLLKLDVSGFHQKKSLSQTALFRRS